MTMTISAPAPDTQATRPRPFSWVCWDDQAHVGYPCHEFAAYPHPCAYLVCTNCGARLYEDDTILPDRSATGIGVEIALLERLLGQSEKRLRSAKRANAKAVNAGLWDARLASDLECAESCQRLYRDALGALRG